MNVKEAEKLVEKYSDSSLRLPIKVTVEGWLVGFEGHMHPNEFVDPGSTYVRAEHNKDGVALLAHVKFDSTRVMSGRTELTGTYINFHDHGGGNIAVPIQFVEERKDGD